MWLRSITSKVRLCFDSYPDLRKHAARYKTLLQHGTNCVSNCCLRLRFMSPYSILRIFRELYNTSRLSSVQCSRTYAYSEDSHLKPFSQLMCLCSGSVMYVYGGWFLVVGGRGTTACSWRACASSPSACSSTYTTERFSGMNCPKETHLLCIREGFVRLSVPWQGRQRRQQVAHTSRF